MCLRRSIRNCLPSWRARKATSSAHRRRCDYRAACARRRGDRVKRPEFIMLCHVSPFRNSRLAVILFAASLIILWGNAAMAMTLKSPAFQQNGHIPSKYTCEGEDVSPPLAWEGVPNGANSLVLIIDDPDAPD